MTQINPQKKYDTGAVRSGDCEDTRYDLISPIGLAALARTYAEGAAKFGAFNWENGMPVTDLLNHAIAHVYKFLGGDRTEDHLGHAAWNLLGAIHSLDQWPHLNEGYLRGPGCTCPPAATTPAEHVDDIAFEQIAPRTYAVEYGDAARNQNTTITAPAGSVAAAQQISRDIAAGLDALKKAVLAAETTKPTTNKPE